MKKKLNLVIKILVSIVLFWIIFRSIDLKILIGNFSNFQPIYAVLIVLCLVLNYVVSSIRWKGLLIHEGGNKVSVWYLTRLYFVGSFFNNFLPTSIGGDVYKIYKLGKKIGSTSDSFAATFMERFTGVISLMLISLVSLWKYLSYWSVVLTIGFLLLFVLGLYVLRFLSTKHSIFSKLYGSFSLYRAEKKVLGFALVTSFVVQFLSVFTQYFVFRALGLDVPFIYALVVLPMITLAGFFIPSLNSMGVQDALYIQVFSYVGVGRELAFTASILYHFFRLVVSLVGGVFYVFEENNR